MRRAELTAGWKQRSTAVELVGDDGSTMTSGAGADRDDDAARSALAWYDIGAVLSLD